MFKTAKELANALNKFADNYIFQCKAPNISASVAEEVRTYMAARGFILSIATDGGLEVANPAYPCGIPEGVIVPTLIAAIKDASIPTTLPFNRTRESVAELQEERAQNYEQVQRIMARVGGNTRDIAAHVFTYIVQNRSAAIFMGEQRPKEPTDLHVSALECWTSPTGTCVYNAAVDEGHSRCLFCGLSDDWNSRVNRKNP